MTFFSGAKKNYFIFLIPVLLVNIFIFGYFFKQTPELAIADIKTRNTEEGFIYNIEAKSNYQTSATANIEVFFSSGPKKVLKWDLMEGDKNFEIQDSRIMEFARLVIPSGVEDTNPENNSIVINIWSPKIKVEEVTVKSDFDYLVDEKDNIWFVFCDKSTGDNKPQIYLNIISPEGNYLVRRKRLSVPGEYSVGPKIIADSQGKHIAWCSYHHGKDIVKHICLKLENNSLNITNQHVLEHPDGLSIFSPRLYHYNDSVFLLVQQEERIKGSYRKNKYFTVYQLEGNDFIKKWAVLFGKSRVALGAIEPGKVFYHELFQDGDGNFYIIWANMQSMHQYIYFCRINPEGKVEISNKKIRVMFFRGNPYLNCSLVEENFHLFWMEFNNPLQRYNEVNHMIVDKRGEIVKEDYRLAAPTPMIVRGIEMTVDSNNQLNVVWSDERWGRPSVNQDIIYCRFSSNGELQVPKFRITKEKVDENDPKLVFKEGKKYLLWFEYTDHNTYEYFLKNTDPEFKQLLEQRNKWPNFAEKAGSIVVSFLISVAGILIFFVPFNILPIFGMLGYLSWMSRFYQYNNILSWIGVILGLLPLKVLNEMVISRNFSNLLNIGLKRMYQINLISLLLLGIFFLVIKARAKKLDSFSYDRDFQVLFIVCWLLFDTIIALTANMLYYLG